MQLSEFEKLALWMICDVYEKVGATEFDPNFIREAIFSGNTWGITARYGGVFGETMPKKIVDEVCDILDMWLFIEDASDEKFHGFDSNRESRHVSAARFYTEQLGSFEQFKGRVGQGVLQLDVYRRMYEKFEPIRNELGRRDPVKLTQEEVELILAERKHPDYR